MKISWIRYVSLNVAILLIFSIDRLLKNYFIQNPAKVIGGDFIYELISLRLAKNTGIAFGFLFNQFFLVPLIIIAILLLLSFLIRAYQKNLFWQITALSLIVFGAASNLIDRLRYGFVVDYLDVPFFTVFNLADCLITFGVFIITFWIWFRPKSRP
jgi:signal peptidase II